MANFTPPIRAGQVILQSEADTEPIIKRAMAHFAPNRYGVPVFILKDDGKGGVGNAVQEYYPPALYNSNGSIKTLPEDRILYFFQGNATYSNIPAQAATILSGAGYTLS